MAGKGIKNTAEKAAILGAIAGAQHVRLMAKHYGVPVVLHSDHCAKKLLPWFDGMLEADEAYFKVFQISLKLISVFIYLKINRNLLCKHIINTSNFSSNTENLYFQVTCWIFPRSSTKKILQPVSNILRE